MLEVGKPTIIVLAAGSSVNVGTDKMNALIDAWYPGAMGGRALADIIFGNISPSGKLPVTFYKSAEKLPDFEDYSMQGRTYRYTHDNILYPFGYGLTYSECRVESLSFSDGKAVCTVSNNGSRDTDEVLQLYIKIHGSQFAVPNYSLCGFKRLNLKPGEKREVTLEIPEDSFTVVDNNGKRLKDGTGFTLYGGFSQPDKLSCQLTGASCVEISCEF